MNLIIKLLLPFFFLGICAHSAPISTKAKYAIVIDYDTEAILFEKDAYEKIYPASMSKLMTLYVLFDELSKGTLDLDTEFFVSKKAWKKGGSKMFVEPETKIKIKELLKGIIVQSGNDACIVVAEGISGDEEAFSDLMNEKAREMGLKGSNFTNSTGWPDENHYMTPYDVAILSKKIIEDFPNFFKMFKDKEYTFNNIKQNNRNPLLYSYKYADGLKTGYTEESGFSLAATAKKANRRLIAVLSGMENNKERRDETTKVIEWAFREYTNVNLFKANEPIVEADVWLGNKAIVDLITKYDVEFTIPKKNLKTYTAKVLYNSPIEAPINKDSIYGKLVVSNTINGQIEYQLYANEVIKKAGVFKKLSSAISYFIFGGYAE